MREMKYKTVFESMYRVCIRVILTYRLSVCVKIMISFQFLAESYIGEGGHGDHGVQLRVHRCI
jgi:hypothetical protein